MASNTEKRLPILWLSFADLDSSPSFSALGKKTEEAPTAVARLACKDNCCAATVQEEAEGRHLLFWLAESSGKRIHIRQMEAEPH